MQLDAQAIEEAEQACRSEDGKGARWMPWHRKPTKDAASCDKLRRGAHARRPADLRMGEPAGARPPAPPAESIGRAEATRGTETSKYPEEEKSNEIPPVAASERGRGQTRGRASAPGVAGPARADGEGKRNGMGRPAAQG